MIAIRLCTLLYVLAIKPLAILPPQRRYYFHDHFMLVSMFVTSKSNIDFEIRWSVALYVCLNILGHNFEARFLIFSPIVLSGVRIEEDRILTKLVTVSHSYGHFSCSE